MDTPETDALYERLLKENPGNLIYLAEMLELARKLEQERDEAREELSDIRLNLGADAEGFTLLHAVCAVQNERDEARTERDILKLAAQREAEHHDKMVGELEKVYKERDEVREHNAKFLDKLYRDVEISQLKEGAK